MIEIKDLPKVPEGWSEWVYSIPDTKEIGAWSSLHQTGWVVDVSWGRTGIVNVTVGSERADEALTHSTRDAKNLGPRIRNCAAFVGGPCNAWLEVEYMEPFDGGRWSAGTLFAPATPPPRQAKESNLHALINTLPDGEVVGAVERVTGWQMVDGADGISVLDAPFALLWADRHGVYSAHVIYGAGDHTPLIEADDADSLDEGKIRASRALLHTIADGQVEGFGPESLDVLRD